MDYNLGRLFCDNCHYDFVDERAKRRIAAGKLLSLSGEYVCCICNQRFGYRGEAEIWMEKLSEHVARKKKL